MAEKKKISQSRVNRWNTCKASYNYRYNKKLRRRRHARPLTFGSSVHKVIEDQVEGVKDLKKSLDKWAAGELEQRKLFVEEKQMFQETIEEAWDIMREYQDFWPKDHMTYLKVKGKKSEHELYWEPPGEDFAVYGKVDAYGKSKNGLKWLVEHKSGKMMMSEEDRWRSMQTAIYITAGREVGYPDVDGILWDMVKSKTPSRPQMLQNGTFSLKKIDSLPSVVYETIRSEGHDPNDYPTLLANAEKTREHWFQRTFQPVTENVREYLYGEFVGSAREILDHGEKASRMTIGRHCSWCDFEPICRAIMTGNDVNYVMEKEYTVAEKVTESETKRSKKATSGTTKKPVGRRRTRRVKSTRKES